MKYDLSIRQQNIQPHLDIENELQLKKNGLFTFLIRVNDSNIVDLSIMENVDVKRNYLATAIIIEKLTFASGSGDGVPADPVRSDNLQRSDQGRSGTDDNV